MAHKNPLEAAEARMLGSQAAYAHKLTPDTYARMRRDQIAYHRLLQERQAEGAPAAGPPR